MWTARLKSRLSKFVWTDLVVILIYLALVGAFWQKIAFPDEYEQITAGWFLLHRLIPYRDFFSHHGPLPLYIGILGFVPSWFDPVVTLRAWVILFQLSVWIILLAKTDRRLRRVLYFVIISFGLATPRLLLHQALADTFTTFALTAIMLLLLDFWLYGKTVQRSLLLILLASALISFWSTVASLIPLAILGLIGFGVLVKKADLTWLSQAKLPFTVFALANFGLILPHILTRSFSQFWWQVFTYNTVYYYPLHLTDSDLEKRYGLIYQMAATFSQQLVRLGELFVSKHTVLLQSLWGFRHVLVNSSVSNSANYLNIVWQEYARVYESFEYVVFFGLVFLIISLLWKKKILGLILALVLFISLFFRSNEVFHWGPLFSVLVIGLGLVTNQVVKKKSLILTLVVGWVVVGLTYNLAQYYVKTWQVSGSYLPIGFETQVKQVTNWTRPGDAIMVLDRNMAFYAYSQTLPACRQTYYLPWFHDTPQIRVEMEQCLSSGQARVLVIPDTQIREVKDLMPLVVERYRVATEGAVVWVKL